MVDEQHQPDFLSPAHAGGLGKRWLLRFSQLSMTVNLQSSSCVLLGLLRAGTPSMSPNGAQGLSPPLEPSLCLQLPPHMAQDGVLEIKHPAPDSWGGVWELLSLEETQPAQRREQGDGWLQTLLWQDPHRARQRKHPQPPKGFIPLKEPQSSSAQFLCRGDGTGNLLQPLQGPCCQCRSISVPSWL